MTYREAAGILEGELNVRRKGLFGFAAVLPNSPIDKAYRMAIDMLKKEAYKTEHAETVYYKGVK